MDNYVTFISSKFQSINRENGYCLEENLFGEYLVDELGKKCNYLNQTYFTDFGYQLNFKIGKRKFYSLLTVVNDQSRKYSISTNSCLNTIERTLKFSDEEEHSMVNKLLDDILRLDSSVSEIAWTNKPKAELNKYEAN